MSRLPFSHLTAVERAAALVDPGSLAGLAGDAGGRSTVTTARGRIDGRETVLALTDGHTRGGTIGQDEARQLSRAAADAGRRRSALVVCWDTGGVRVQEGPAALAAASAAGVALTRLSLSGPPIAHLVCGPRGCFGAPAVIAATGHRTLIVEGALWGLTGPGLVEGAASEREARAAMSAQHRRDAGHASDVVADQPTEVRAALATLIAQPLNRVGALGVLDRCVATAGTLLAQWNSDHAAADDDGAPAALRTGGRQRDFFSYSFRRQWRPHPDGPLIRTGNVHAAWGTLAGRPAMAILVGPERSPRGIGIADAHTVLRALHYAVQTAPGAAIVTFLFCRGHAGDLREERAGLPRALAECLRGMVAARLHGHPLVCVLGGGAYGAAYLTLAAPSHRILAIRGTAVAPMAPRVLAAFQRLRGVRAAAETPPDLAQLIPEIRIVESVVRLPRILADELEAARHDAATQRHRARFAVAATANL